MEQQQDQRQEKVQAPIFFLAQVDGARKVGRPGWRSLNFDLMIEDEEGRSLTAATIAVIRDPHEGKVSITVGMVDKLGDPESVQSKTKTFSTRRGA